MKIWVSENLTSINCSLKFHQFEVEGSKKISALKIDVSNKISIDSSNFDLYRNDFLLDNNRSIEYLQVSENSVLQTYLVDAYSLCSVTDQEKYLIINIKQLLPNETNCIKIEKFHVKSNCTIKSFHNQLKCEKKIPNFKSLFHLSRMLESDKTFQECEIEDYDEIKLVDNVVLVNYENCLYDAKLIRELNLESEELNDNLTNLCQVWNTDSNFISVIYKGKIVKEIPNGTYFSFICDGNDIDDSVLVFVTEYLTISGVFSKHGISLNKSDLVSSTIIKIRSSLNIENFVEFKIRFNDQILDMDKCLIDYGISNFSDLVLVCRIYIEVFNSNQTLPFWICLSDKVSKLKSLILTSEIDKESFDLFFLGDNMLDNEVLSNYGVEINSIITLIDSIENISISNLILIDYEFHNFISNSIHIVELQSESDSENRNILSLNTNIDSNIMRISYQEQIIKSVANGKYFYFTQINDDLDENVMIFLAEGFNENCQLKRHAILFSKTNSVGSLIEQIKHLLNIPNLRKLKIQFDGIVLEKSKILSEYEIRNGSELRLLRRISVKQLGSDEFETYWMYLENSFLQLKEMISSKLEININLINLYYFGELISDEELLATYETDIDYTVITIVMTSDEIQSIYRCILIDYQNCIFNSDRFHQIDCQFEDGYENLKYLSEITKLDSNFMFIIYDEEKIKKIPIGKYLYGILGNDDSDQSIIVYVEESFSKNGEITKHAILLNRNDSVDSVKKKIVDDLQINCIEFEIRINEINLNSNSTLSDYQIISGSTLTILFKINVTRLSCDDSLSFWMFPSDSIVKLKQFISNNLKVDVNHINLFFLGKLIPDEETFSENGILANCEILMSEQISSVCHVTLVDHKECYYLTEDSNINRIQEINFECENVNENRYELSKAIDKNYNLINVIHNEEIIKVIPNGKYLYFIHDGNYCENSIIVFVKESLSCSGELKTLSVLMNKTDTISGVLKTIVTILDRKEEVVQIRFNEIALENDKMLSNYDIKNGSELILLICIFITSLEGRKNTLFISLCDTVKDIKYLISKLKGDKVEQINLYFRSKKLEDEKVCSDYEIDCGTTLITVSRLKGGIMMKLYN